MDAVAFNQFILLLASCAVGTTFILNKKIAAKHFSAATNTSAITITSAIVALPLLFVHFYASTSLWTWLLIFLSVTVYGIGNYFGFRAYKETDASIVGIINKSSVVLTALLGIFLLHEGYTDKKYIGLFLILLSNIVILFEKKKIVVNRGILFAFIMAGASSLAGVFDKQILNDFSPFTYVFVNNFLIWLLFAFRKNALRDTLSCMRTNTLLVSLCALFNTGSWTAFLFVLQKTNVSQTLPVYKGLSFILPVVLGITLLGENNKLWQKILGVIIGVGGIMLLY